MSTERALLIRTALEPVSCRYFAVGMDFPSVRVFDTATGDLCSIVEPAKRQQQLSSVLHSAGGLTGSPFAVSLSCIAFGSGVNGATLLAAGLSDGSLMLHNVTADDRIAHINVSVNQQPVLAVAFCDDDKVVVLSRGGQLTVLSVASRAVVSKFLEVPKSATHLSAATEQATGTCRVLVAGPICNLYELTVSQSGVSLEPRKTFAVQSGAVNFSWLRADGTVAVTCGAQEGVVRVWDLAGSSSVTGALCKRTLPVGHRVGHMRVVDATTTAHASVVVTTFLGQVLVWDLGSTLVQRVSDAIPIEPTLVLVSSEAATKILVGDLIPATQQLITVRGRFALPRFEGRSLRTLLEAAVVERVQRLDLLGTGTQASKEDSSAILLDTDNEWASHRATASRAAVGYAQEFPVPKVFHANSVSELPSSSASAMRETALEHRAATAAAGSTVSGAMGSVTVPLYQALHAGDAGLVMELLTVSSRSDTEIRQCILSLHMPFLLQLLRILSERVKVSNSRSPLFRWISAIVQLRGAEMHRESTLPAAADSVGQSGDSAKTFIAPLLARYQSVVSLYDKLADAYGRLSIFKSVNPESITSRKRSKLIHTDTAVADGIRFPKAFRLVDRGNGDPRVLVVHSKVEQRAQKTRRRVKKSSKSKTALDAAEGSDDELSLNSDEMEAMMNDEELTLDAPETRVTKNKKTAVIAAEDENLSDGEDDEDFSEDFDESSDELIDSDEEAEDDGSDVDSSPDEEGEDEDDEEDGDHAEDDDDEEDDDDDEPGNDEPSDSYDVAALTKSRDPAQRRVRTD